MVMTKLSIYPIDQLLVTVFSLWLQKRLFEVAIISKVSNYNENTS
jgi:hypothetical protein